MRTERVILLRGLSAWPEGTWGRLCTYKDGSQLLKFPGMTGRGFKVNPGDKGRLFQHEDPGVKLPIRVPYVVDDRPCMVFRRLLTPKGKLSRYWQACTSHTMAAAAKHLDDWCASQTWRDLLRKGYSWEPVICIGRNFRK